MGQIHRDAANENVIATVTTDRVGMTATRQQVIIVAAVEDVAGEALTENTRRSEFLQGQDK